MNRDSVGSTWGRSKPRRKPSMSLKGHDATHTLRHKGKHMHRVQAMPPTGRR
jgi:hypothetical protein